jgi:endoglucanase
VANDWEQLAVRILQALADRTRGLVVVGLPRLGSLLSAVCFATFLVSNAESDERSRYQHGSPGWKVGVNLSGAELNPGRNQLNRDYVFPTFQQIDYFQHRGLRVFRIPTLIDRLFVRPSSREAAATECWLSLVELIDHAARVGAEVILDFHQYGRTRSGLIGRDKEATSEFVAAWAEAAARLRNKPNVIFGLMNEPHEQSAKEWLAAANAAIAAIRKAGARQLILVPGSSWSGAHSWTTSDNGAVMKGVVDPQSNFAYEVHQYLDRDSSGASPDVVLGAGGARLVSFTEWARRNNVHAFLGEFGFAATQQGLEEGQALVAYMAANRDVWIGWTYWAAGQWWGDYMFSVEPERGRDKPQLEILTSANPK